MFIYSECETTIYNHIIMIYMYVCICVVLAHFQDHVKWWHTVYLKSRTFLLRQWYLFCDNAILFCIISCEWHEWVTLKNYLPKHILRTLYNSLILPHLQYSVLTWGFKMGKVELLQKHAVRVISCSKYNVHTDPLFKQLNLLKVKDIFDLNAMNFFYKLNQNCLPVYVTDMFQDFSREHDHNTRQSLVLNNVFSSSRYGENCIRFYLPLLVNNSSQCVLEKVMTHCYQGFISYIKKTHDR